MQHEELAFDVAEAERESARRAYERRNGMLPNPQQLEEFMRAHRSAESVGRVLGVTEGRLGKTELDNYIGQYKKTHNGETPTPQQLEDYLNQLGPQMPLEKPT